MRTEFKIRELSSFEQRATFVSRMLGNPNDLSDKDRPFLWQSTDEEITDDMPWPGQKKVSKLTTLLCYVFWPHKTFSPGVVSGADGS